MTQETSDIRQARSFIKEINLWAGNDSGQWDSLHELVKKHYRAGKELTARDYIVAWVGTKLRSLHKDNLGSSWYRRQAKSLEKNIHTYFVEDKEFISKVLLRKVRSQNAKRMTSDT